MNHFSVLFNQVKKAIMGEAKLSSSERQAFSWQYTVIVGDIPYTVGKQGANTMYYTINGDDPKVCYPDDMLGIIKSWGSEKYVSFIISKEGKKVKGPFKSLDEAKAKKPKKFMRDLVIKGKTKSGEVKTLCRLENSLKGLTWITSE